MLLRSQEPLLRFGVFADAQYDRDTTDNPLHRHYAKSRIWLAEAMDRFNGEDLAFVVSLGDLIDRSAGALEDILPTLHASQAPIYYVYGNHDYPKPYDKAVQRQIFKTLGQDDGYRCLHFGDVDIILLNTNEIATYSSKPGSKAHKRAEQLLQTAKDAHLPYARKYNGALSDKQLKWLDRELRKAERKGQKAIVMGHAPIAPDSATATEMNAPAIREVLHSHEKTVLAYFSGHEHKGGLEMLGSIPCLTFLGVCEGTQNRYAIVSVYGNGIKVQGFGDQESYDFFKEP
jgi:3',5'-cyclic AMP phosphodiesterase CpdA